MHRTLLDLLACPTCRVGFDPVVHAQLGEAIETGVLRCPRCALAVPVLEGLVLFTEALADPSAGSAEGLAETARRLFGSADAHAGYRADKRRRGVIESYAALAPFNESVRVLEPVLPHAVGGLRDGDAIVDLWCRTGWSGEWLAARFPRQRVVSVWDGDSSVLGYRGYRHLLGSGMRSPNLDVVFCRLDAALPFRDGAFGMVHGYDSLHRFGLEPYAGECLRIARSDAPVLFPHVHLSNSEPQPYFVRGGRHLHGREYRAWLDRVLADDARRGLVLSEADLFDGPDVAALADAPDMPHYNGFVAILPRANVPAPAEPAADSVRRFAISPLFRFNLARGIAQVAPGQFDGAIGHFLPRHPIYAKRLPAEPVMLSSRALLAALLATIGSSEAAIVASEASDPGCMRATLRELVGLELLRPAAISEAGHRLQRFHANQWPARAGGVLAGFWSGIAACDQVLLVLDDGEELRGSDLYHFAASLARAWPGLGIAAGDRIAVRAQSHPLLLFAALAAAACGVHVVLVGAGWTSGGEVRLLLHGDGDHGSKEMPALPLGLSGQSPSLAVLWAGHTPESGAWHPRDDGRIDFEEEGGRMSCLLADLVDAVESLSAQIESALWLLDGHCMFMDLIRCVAACRAGETMRVLAGDARV